VADEANRRSKKFNVAHAFAANAGFAEQGLPQRSLGGSLYCRVSQISGAASRGEGSPNGGEKSVSAKSQRLFFASVSGVVSTCCQLHISYTPPHISSTCTITVALGVVRRCIKAHCSRCTNTDSLESIPTSRKHTLQPDTKQLCTQKARMCRLMTLYI
jgi:hypothetical protein